jgi:plasmid maintenance system antidote protein VapI
MATARINRRILDTKRHTVGYVITGNKRITRKEAVRLAKRNQISGVRIVNGQTSDYLMSTTKRSLQDLPIVIDNDLGRRRRTR